MAKREYIDWDSIEPIYRARQLSLHQICAQYESDHINSGVFKKTVTHTAILKKAREKKWTRNLAGQVKDRIKEKLVSNLVSNCNQAANRSDNDIIEEVAEAGANVVVRHRTEIKALLDREDALLSELDTDIKKKKSDITLKDKTVILKNIMFVRAQRIALERQAYNLNDSDNSDDIRKCCPVEFVESRSGYSK